MAVYFKAGGNQVVNHLSKYADHTGERQAVFKEHCVGKIVTQARNNLTLIDYVMYNSCSLTNPLTSSFTTVKTLRIYIKDNFFS